MMSWLSSLWSLCPMVLALWKDKIVHIKEGGEFRNGSQCSEREKGTKVYGQLFFRAAEIKYYRNREDMKWVEEKFKFIHLFYIP